LSCSGFLITRAGCSSWEPLIDAVMGLGHHGVVVLAGLVQSLAQTVGSGRAASNASRGNLTASGNTSITSTAHAPLGVPCVAPVGIAHAGVPACAEGPLINSSGTCTAQCEGLYVPSGNLQCSDGAFEPATFICLEKPCTAPSHIANAFVPPCLQGAFIDQGGCITKCMRGFAPSVPLLNCSLGDLQPSHFSCRDVCVEQRILKPTIPGSYVTGWCEHVTCGPLVVLHARGLALMALALLGHVPCARLRPWDSQSTLARADVLMVSAADLQGLRAGHLQEQGFTGAVVLVDAGCDLRHPTGLHSDELQQRLSAAGVAVPGFATHAELVELMHQAGTPPAVPAPLRCWEHRTLYLGADRVAASIYGATLEVPPGAQALLDNRGLDRILQRLASLQARPRVAAPAGSRPKLLAYLADECLPDAEAFFDMAVESLGDIGPVEALGMCHGSHPEARPPSCGAHGRFGACKAARHDAAAVLALYRFALAFEVSATGLGACPRHVGSGALFDALAAGTVPVYRGPPEAAAVISLEALVLVPPSTSLREGLARLCAIAQDGSATGALASIPALPVSSAQRWFAWDTALQGDATDLGREAAATLQSLSRDSPYGRCAAYVRERLGGVGRIVEL